MIFQFTAIRGSPKLPQREDQKMPKLSIDCRGCAERFPSMKMPDEIARKKAWKQEEDAEKCPDETPL